MAAEAPEVAERRFYVDLHLNGVDDPTLTLSDLRDMGGGGVNANKAASADSAKRLTGSNKPYTKPETDLKFQWKTSIVPKEYGIVGDGITDDTAAFTSMLAACRAVKGVITLPPLTYLISSQLNPADCTIWGYGATIKVPNAVVGFNVFQATSGPANIFGLAFDLNKANTTDPASSTQGLAIYVFRAAGGDLGNYVDCKVNNAWGAGIRVASTIQTDSKNALITRANIRNLVCDNTAYGVFINGCSDVSVFGGKLTNIAQCAVQDNNSLRTSIEAVTVDTTGDHGIVSLYGYSTRVIGNHCSNTGFAGVAMGGGSVLYPVGRYYVVADNICLTNWNHGITLDPTITGSPGISQSTYGVVTGNICANNGQVSGNGQGIYVHNAADVTITGNNCRNNQGAGIALDGLRCAVSGNNLALNTTYGLEMRGVVGTDHGGHSIGVNNYFGNGIDVFESAIQAVPNFITPTSFLGAVKAVATIRNNTAVLAADPELTIPNVPVGKYQVEALLIYDASTVADFRFSLNTPAGSTFVMTGGLMGTGATTFGSAQENRPTPTAGLGVAGGIGVGTQAVTRPLGTLIVTTAGTVTLTWAQGTAEATDTTLAIGSHLSLRRIA